MFLDFKYSVLFSLLPTVLPTGVAGGLLHMKITPDIDLDSISIM